MWLLRRCQCGHSQARAVGVPGVTVVAVGLCPSDDASARGFSMRDPRLQEVCVLSRTIFGTFGLFRVLQPGLSFID